MQKMLYVAFHTVGETMEEGTKIHAYYVIHETSRHTHIHTVLGATYHTFPMKMLQENKNSHCPPSVRDSPINYRVRQTACRIRRAGRGVLPGTEQRYNGVQEVLTSNPSCEEPAAVCTSLPRAVAGFPDTALLLVAGWVWCRLAKINLPR